MKVVSLVREMGRKTFALQLDIGNVSSFDQTTKEVLDMVYNIHFKSVCSLTQILLPLINDGSLIVNISTGLPRISLPDRWKIIRKFRF